MTMPIRRCAARYFNTLPRTSSAAKASSPTNDMASAVAHHAKPAFVYSPGVKPTFSSNSRSKDTDTWEAKRAAWKAEMEAEIAALGLPASNTKLEPKNKPILDDFKAWKTKYDKDAAEFRSYFRRLVLLWTLLATVFIVESSRRAYVKRKSSEIAADDNAVVEGPSAS